MEPNEPQFPDDPFGPPIPTLHLLNELRRKGWDVAVHNDYRVNGERHTFWLLTNAETGRFVKGEGTEDRFAIMECYKQIVELEQC